MLGHLEEEKLRVTVQDLPYTVTEAQLPDVDVEDLT